MIYCCAGAASQLEFMLTLCEVVNRPLSFVGWGRGASRVGGLQTRLLTAEGGTSVAAGLIMAQKVLQEREHRNPVSAVMLLSDGCDGGGASSCEHVASALRDAGTSVYTWGCVAVGSRATKPRHLSPVSGGLG